MKLLSVILFLTSASAFAIDMKSVSSKAMDAGKQITSACKSEKVEFCKTANGMGPLKDCLMKNKEKLSDGCKKAIGL
jgi:hypothetical protein